MLALGWSALKDSKQPFAGPLSPRLDLAIASESAVLDYFIPLVPSVWGDESKMKRRCFEKGKGGSCDQAWHCSRRFAVGGAPLVESRACATPATGQTDAQVTCDAVDAHDADTA